MNNNIKLPTKYFYIIMVLSILIIFSNSIEAFIRAKDVYMFELWLDNPALAVDKTMGENFLFQIYVTSIIATYITNVITIVGLSINTYIAHIKTGYSKLFVYIWIVILGGLFLFTSVLNTSFNIFYFINLGLTIGLIFILLRLLHEIKDYHLNV
ncbi:MAG: hypothetical protein WBO70_07140 [Erysipelotrichaceae bacterium]